MINADCYIGDNFVGGVVKVIDDEASDDENIKYKKGLMNLRHDISTQKSVIIFLLH